MPFLAKTFAASLSRAYKSHPRRALEKQFGRHASLSGRRLLDRPDIFAPILLGARESVRQGGAGMALEMMLLMGSTLGIPT